jgi:hypothetical protein
MAASRVALFIAMAIGAILIAIAIMMLITASSQITN